MSPMEYPLANPPMYGDSDYESRGGRIVSMSPDQFLSFTPDLTLDDESQDNIEDLMDMMKQGREIDPPTIYLDGDRVVDHDGRHRAYAAKNLGMTHIPVLLIDRGGNPAQYPIRENIKNIIGDLMESYEYQVRDIDGPIYYKRKKGNKLWDFTDKKDFDKNSDENNVIAHLPDLIKENRDLGTSLADAKGPGVSQIYRAVANDVDKFMDRDYVTLSLKFAVEHAENNNIVYDDTYHVITTIVNNDEIFDASNPGEYLYGGPEKRGKLKYVSKGYEYEGYEELEKSDFIFENLRLIIRDTIEKLFENKLVHTGDKTFSDGEIYHMTGDDEYIHFTSPENARKIFNDRKLSVPGDSSVFAISLTYGSHTPGVQTDRLAEPVAILFTTDKKPKSGFSEEVTWTGDVPLKTAEVIPYDRALKMLDGAPEKIDGDDSVVYERYEYRETVTDQDLMRLENELDRLFANANIDVVFTNHFMDRVRDERNVTDITIEELRYIFKQTYKQYKEELKQYGPGFDGMIRSKDHVNIPFTLQWDKQNQELDLVNKTIMRKKGFKNNDKKFFINEAKSKFQKLQDNKIPLTDEEREEVMKKKATWNHGPNGKPSPAVWKSKNKKGDVTYITHTHRAYNTAKSLGAAINKYHNFIKGTS